MSSYDPPVRVEEFRSAVDEVIVQIERSWSGTRRWDQQAIGATEGADRTIDEVLDQAYRDGTKDASGNAAREEFRQAAIQASSALKSSSVRAALCRVLRPTAEGASGIANVLVPVFLPMAVAGTIAIPVAPLVWALVAVTIARIGVANLCPGTAGSCANC
jgi:hypothetical protein